MVLGLTGWAVWKLLIVKKWVEDVEYEGNVDADAALEELEDGEEEKADKKKEEEGKGNEKGKGKGKGGKK